MQEARVWSLGSEDPLEKATATLSSILVWEIPWTEEPGGLHSIRSQRVRHYWSNLACTLCRKIGYSVLPKGSLSFLLKRTINVPKVFSSKLKIPLARDEWSLSARRQKYLQLVLVSLKLWHWFSNVTFGSIFITLSSYGEERSRRSSKSNTLFIWL